MVKRNEREILPRLRKCKVAEGLPKSSMEVKDSIRYKTNKQKQNQNQKRVLWPWEAGGSTESLYRDPEDHPSSFHFTGEGCSFLVSFFSYWKAEVKRKLSTKRKKKNWENSPSEKPTSKAKSPAQRSQKEPALVPSVPSSHSARAPQTCDHPAPAAGQ